HAHRRGNRSCATSPALRSVRGPRGHAQDCGARNPPTMRTRPPATLPRPHFPLLRRARMGVCADPNLDGSAFCSWLPQPPAGRCLLTWATRSFSLTGFTSTSFAPWRMPHMRSVSMLLVVTINTGIALVSGSLVRLRVAWKPFMPGMITSISTRSGLVLCAASMPASALATEVTLCPARSSAPEKIFTSVGESSMIRMFAIVSPCLMQQTACALFDGRDVLPDRVQQFVAREGFGEVLLGTDDAAARLVEQAILRRQHDHRRRTEHVVVLDQRAG